MAPRTQQALAGVTPLETYMRSRPIRSRIDFETGVGETGSRLEGRRPIGLVPELRAGNEWLGYKLGAPVAPVKSARTGLAPVNSAPSVFAEMGRDFVSQNKALGGRIARFMEPANVAAEAVGRPVAAVGGVARMVTDPVAQLVGETTARGVGVFSPGAEQALRSSADAVSALPQRMASPTNTAGLAPRQSAPAPAPAASPAQPAPPPETNFVESRDPRTGGLTRTPISMDENAPFNPLMRRGRPGEMDFYREQAERQAGISAPASGLAPRQEPSVEDRAAQAAYTWATNPMNRDTPAANAMLMGLAGGGRGERTAGMTLDRTMQDKAEDRAMQERIAQIKSRIAPADAKVFDVAVGAIDTNITGIEAQLSEAKKTGMWTSKSEQEAIGELENQLAEQKAEKQRLIDQMLSGERGGSMADRAAQSVQTFADQKAKRITTQAEYDALPDGAPYIDATGKLKNKGRKAS
jgi:hypothetical protein